MAKIWLEMVVKQPFMSRKFDAPPSTFEIEIVETHSSPFFVPYFLQPRVNT